MRLERKPLKRSGVGDAAFTLIELLVVMTIAGILITVGLTAGSSLTQRAKAQKCVKNLKGLGTALMAYVQDNGGALPGAVTGQGQKSHPLIELVKYAGSPDVMLCPSDRDALTFSWEDDSAVAASSERYGWNGNPCKKGCSYMYHAALTQMPTGPGGGDLVLPVNFSAIEEPGRVMVLMDGTKAISPLDWGEIPRRRRASRVGTISRTTGTRGIGEMWRCCFWTEALGWWIRFGIPRRERRRL